MPLTYGTLEYFQFLTKVFTNAFSIFVIIATLVYIVEKLLQGERLLKTYNSRFVFARSTTDCAYLAIRNVS